MDDKLDKIYDLIDKMYSDLSGKIDGMGNEIKKVDIKIEHKIEPKIQALFEAKDIIYEKLDNLGEKVDNLSSKLEKQEVEIKVIKGGK